MKKKKNGRTDNVVVKTGNMNHEQQTSFFIPFLEFQ